MGYLMVSDQSYENYNNVTVFAQDYQSLTKSGTLYKGAFLIAVCEKSNRGGLIIKDAKLLRRYQDQSY